MIDLHMILIEYTSSKCSDSKIAPNLRITHMYVYAKNKDVKIIKTKVSTRVYRGVNYLSII